MSELDFARRLKPDLPIDIDWGDGIQDTGLDTTIGVHQYAFGGSYRVRVRDDEGRMGFTDIFVIRKPDITGWLPTVLDAGTTAAYETLRIKGTDFLPGCQVLVGDPNVADPQWFEPARISDEWLEIAILADYFRNLPNVEIRVRNVAPSGRFVPVADKTKTHPTTVSESDPVSVEVVTLNQAGQVPFTQQFNAQFASPNEFDLGPTSQVAALTVPKDTVDRLKAWVRDDPVRARACLDAENASDRPRITLVTYCEAVLLGAGREV